MKENRYTVYKSERGFGMHIETAAGETAEYPCVSCSYEGAETLRARMAEADLDVSHIPDVIRDYITEQYYELLTYNRLTYTRLCF